MINKSIIEQLVTEGILKTVNVFDSVDSTNLRAKEDVRLCLKEGDAGLALLGSRLPALYISDNQTAGRGRLGRTWDTPAGRNIAMTYVVRPCVEPDRMPGITILASIAVARAVKSKAVDIIQNGGGMPDISDSIKIKWPNDIVINGKKICGILTELVSPGYSLCGIGINVNTETFPQELEDRATSLYLETGKTWSLEKTAGDVIKNMSRLVTEYENQKSLEFIREEYNSLLVHMNKEIFLVDKETPDKSGFICRGIDETGALLVEEPGSTGENINIRKIISGEISVRGVYGYV